MDISLQDSDALMKKYFQSLLNQPLFQDHAMPREGSDTPQGSGQWSGNDPSRWTDANAAMYTNYVARVRGLFACEKRPADESGPSVDATNKCVRCHNRQRACTYEWMDKIKNGDASKPRVKRARKGSAVGGDDRRYSQVSPASDADASSRAASKSSVVEHERQSPQLYGNTPSSYSTTDQDLIDERWLESIYSRVWETIFGNWMCRYSCPFVFGDESISESFVSISALCAQLDKWMTEEPDTAAHRTYTGNIELSSDSRIRESLELVIKAYAARWLPLVCTSGASVAAAHSLARRYWREARADMLKVQNRTSYRSVLTLYLFGLTPIPVGISDEEEHDGLSGPVCVQSALQQVYMLRVRQKSLQFSGAKVSPVVTKAFALRPDEVHTNSFINAENIAHWAALTFDTSASLTLSSRPVLWSGLFGYERDRCWSLVKSCTDHFHSMVQKDWHTDGLEISESKANMVIAAASAFKLLMWKLSAVFREALRDGHEDATVNKVCEAVIDAVDQFNRTYRDLLNSCQRRIHFLSQETKLRWYVLMLHYHLSVLLVTDAVETPQWQYLLPRLLPARTEAESSLLTALAFGLETTYAIALNDEVGQLGTNSSAERLTVPLLVIDPYPHHVLAAVELMRRAIDRDVAAGTLTADSHRSILSTLHRAVQSLPESSKSVQAAKKEALGQKNHNAPTR
ncbi:unnamed protein product [Zymoseptoria tritici ST99CH_1E4]|uniref:Zn(2)-C6 fungal-type domain-containing protein n=1 Tax=Zymoseptoria tritici ST99CH_1E4 TaxID=1276532 RepID=A0A2H1G6V2_ZYMTR|nr:unnamed protein product [Zymoseptoria tritici ST99CH_1E4]